MLDDPSKTAQPKPEHTPLHLPGSATSAANSTIASTPIRSNSTPPVGKPRVRLSLALVMLSLVAVTALVLGVLFAVIPLLSQHQRNSTITTPQMPKSTPVIAQITPTTIQTLSTPTATSIPTQTPIAQETTTIAGLTANPSHFSVQSDCQADNGYRCTVTLYASQDIEDSIHWKGASDGVATKFSPASGKLKAGDQQQVIVYIYNQCPYKGSLIFTVEGKHITLPVSC